MGANDADVFVSVGAIGQAIYHYISPGSLSVDVRKVLYRPIAFSVSHIRKVFSAMEGETFARRNRRFADK